MLMPPAFLPKLVGICQDLTPARDLHTQDSKNRVDAMAFEQLDDGATAGDCLYHFLFPSVLAHARVPASVSVLTITHEPPKECPNIWQIRATSKRELGTQNNRPGANISSMPKTMSTPPLASFSQRP